jgi:glycosyltransferase involved in cell wall biosynthesis
MNTVSVIIPTYNRAGLLPQTLASVLAQTYPQVEIIVVDDGSTDETPALLAQYAGRVRVIRQENQGETVARNKGIAAATGDYFTFLDDDDLFLPTKIEKQVRLLCARPDVDVVYCRYYHMAMDGQFLHKTSLMPEGDILPQLAYGNFLGAGTPLVPRRCVEKVGPFDATLPFRGKYSEDWDWFLRLALAGYTFACVQEPLWAYRVGPMSQTANVAQSEQGILAILTKLFAHPQLPEGIAAAKNHIYAVRHLWLSGRYYAIEQWSEAQRHLRQALALHPAWCTSPDDWLESLFSQAMSQRLADPVTFITNTFAHLPSEIASWQNHQDYLLSRIYGELALNDYHQDHIPAAQQKLATAIQLDPSLLTQPERFMETLGHTAMHLPVADPLAYVEKVLAHLPPMATSLIRLRPRILSYVSVASAFEAHATGQRGRVMRQVLNAWRYQPTWLKNRGVTAIFLKALVGSSTQPNRRASAKG